MPTGEGTEREICSLLLTVLRKMARGEESLSFLNQFLEGRAFKKSRILGVWVVSGGRSLVRSDGMRSLNSLSFESLGAGDGGGSVSLSGAGGGSVSLRVSPVESIDTILAFILTETLLFDHCLLFQIRSKFPAGKVRIS